MKDGKIGTNNILYPVHGVRQLSKADMVRNTALPHIEVDPDTFLNARQMKPDTPSHIGDIDVRALLGVTVIYLVTLLSVPLQRTDMIIWFAAYPIISSPLAHVAYERLFRNSLFVLPLLIFIGIFNPIYDRTIALSIFGIAVSAGWISFISIIIRGLLATQALLLLIRVSGFNDICEAMRRMGCPVVIVTQLLMVYRYLSVLLQEALTMQRARMARSYGSSSFKASMWGAFIGQLLLRTILHYSLRRHSLPTPLPDISDYPL